MQVRVTGPLGSHVVDLSAWSRPLVVGRDAQADIHLPDPERLLSRRHLSLSAQANAVEIKVLSSQAVVETSLGALTSGQSASLSVGHSIEVEGYRLWIERGPEAAGKAVVAAKSLAPAFTAPGQGIGDWGIKPADGLAIGTDGVSAIESFLKGSRPQSDAGRPAPAPVRIVARPPPEAVPRASPKVDWSSLLDQVAPVATRADAGPEAAPAYDRHVQAFARGLGIAPTLALEEADWERLGSSYRQLVGEFRALVAARASLKTKLCFSDMTERYLRDNNPFKAAELSIDELLTHLVFRRPNANSYYMNPDKAIEEASEELLVHDLAIVAASRTCIKEIVSEFDPDQFGAVAPKGGLAARIPYWSAARHWQSYVTTYRRNALDMADWLKKLFENHFVAAYVREADQLSRQHVSLP